MPRSIRILLLTAVLIVPVLLLAQDGKVRGKITDKESGEPLIGANVIIEGTSLGASTDVEGEYIILSVPPGVYAIKGSYIGYAAMTISNIRVSSNITTTQDFQLSSTAIQTQAVEVVADRPLIQRNTTNTVRLATQDDIKNIPFRGLQNILALNAGVVQQDGNLYIRGGRNGEVAFFIDGATATNPMFNTEAVSPIQEAIEEFQLQSGGYTAEFGGANSGIVRTSMRTGGSEMKATLDYLTDDFAKPGEEFLGTSSRGYRNAVLTIGGPVISGLRFFMAGQHNYTRNRNHMYLQPFRFDNLTTDGFDNRPVGTALPGPVEFKQNYIYKNQREENTLQSTLVWDLNPFKVRFSGSYAQVDLPVASNWPAALNNYFMKKQQKDDIQNMLGNLRLTHVLGPKTFYEVGISYLNRNARRYDPDFGDDWKLYADSSAAREKGYITADGSTGWRTRYLGPLPYSTINNFPVNHEFTNFGGYNKNNQSSFGLTVDFTSQVTPQWELKTGGRVDAWTMRQYNVGAIGTLNTYLEQSGNKYSPDKLAADPNLRKEYEINVQRQGAMNLFGYDIDGNETDGGLDGGPRKPLMASAYVQNKFEFNDLVLNLGVRYELFDTKNVTPVDYINPEWDSNLNYFANDNALKETDPISLLLPRLSFSFPVTDRTVFYAMYGKYAQMPDLNRLYDGNLALAARISPITRVGYTIAAAPAGTGFLAKPERTTQYEVGIRQTLSDNFAFTVTGFYKDLRDQLQIRRVYSSIGVPIFAAYGNEDFGTVKGFEMTLELRRTNRLQARVNYTLSDARGTASTALSSRNAVSDQSDVRFPAFVNPLDFNQTHRGAIMLDYRWGRGDGGTILEGLGFNALLTFNSGHPYTKILEPKNLGQASPWNIGVRPLIDTRTRNPIEPINASSTPWIFNVDLNASKVFYFEGFTAELYLNVLNLLDSRQVNNVFPNTGTPNDDGWLRSPLAASFVEIPQYADFYRAINLDNRFAYIGATGNDLYAAPREVRLGLKLEL